MPFILKRSKKIEESVQIGDEIIPVSLDIGKINGDFNTRYRNLVNAECELRQIDKTVTPEHLLELQTAYGNGVISLMELIFGIDGAKKIVDFYENDYIELLESIIPFIQETIVPKMREYVKSQQDKYRNYTKRK